MAPSGLWTSRRKGTKLQVSATHEDFPALLSEALDVLAAREWDASAAAQQLGISTSQLVKFLKLEGAALGLLNDERAKADLKPLS